MSKHESPASGESVRDLLKLPCFSVMIHINDNTFGLLVLAPSHGDAMRSVSEIMGDRICGIAVEELWP